MIGLHAKEDFKCYHAVAMLMSMQSLKRDADQYVTTDDAHNLPNSSRIIVVLVSNR